MKKRLLIPTLIIGTLLTGSLALAGPGGCGSCSKNGGCDKQGQGQNRGTMTYEQHEERLDRRMEMMSTVLELTETQQEQIEALHNQKWQDRQGQREEMQAARDAMREARNADPFDEADFRAKAAKKNELKTEMMIDHAKMKQEFYAILTPEQQEKADKLGGMMGGNGKGRHGGKGSHF